MYGVLVQHLHRHAYSTNFETNVKLFFRYKADIKLSIFAA